MEVHDLGPLRWRFVFLWSVATLVASCGGAPRQERPDDGETGCSDRDGDGFGEGPACAGADCNDLVATIHTPDECAAWCETDEPRPGCPCTGGEPSLCYLGAPETIGVGPCDTGVTDCVGGTWGPCSGQVAPVDEVCDEVDNDCDGESDEGLLLECGVCGKCDSDCAGVKCDPWGDVPPGLALDTQGWLKLDDADFVLDLIWPPSPFRGSVIKMNAWTAQMLGDYWTGPNHGLEGDSPSAFAVDDRANLIAVNRGLVREPSVTKIASYPEYCPDRDGDGVVRTSTRYRERLEFRSHEDWDDDCILWHTLVGRHPDSFASSVVLHRMKTLDGALTDFGWVGLFRDHEFQQFDAETGELTGEVADTHDILPMGAAIDRDGWVWAIGGYYEPRDSVGRFDTADPDGSFEIVPLPINAGTGIVVDEQNTPWVASFSTGVARLDRETGLFERVDGFDGLATSLGGVAADGRGSVWFGSFGGDEFVFRASTTTDDVHVVETPGVLSFGMAADFAGQVWAFGYIFGNASLIKIETEQTQEVLRCGDDFGCLNFPEVTGDITGVQRRAAHNPTGDWRRVVEGCDVGETRWGDLTAYGLVQEDTTLAISVRGAERLPDLPTAEWIHVGTVVDGENQMSLEGVLPVTHRYVEVRATFWTEDPTHTPLLRNVELRWGCPLSVD